MTDRETLTRRLFLAGTATFAATAMVGPYPRPWVGLPRPTGSFVPRYDNTVLICWGHRQWRQDWIDTAEFVMPTCARVPYVWEPPSGEEIMNYPIAD